LLGQVIFVCFISVVASYAGENKIEKCQVDKLGLVEYFKNLE